MAKTLVKNKICEACGADVRPGSLFCYSCGTAVAPEAKETLHKNQNKTVREAILEEESKDKNDLKTTRLAEPALEKAADTPIPKPTIQEDAKLKSAANLRRRAKSIQKKTIEVVWEEPDQSPNKWFPLVAVVLLIFVLLIFYLAMTLK